MNTTCVCVDLNCYWLTSTMGWCCLQFSKSLILRFRLEIIYCVDKQQYKYVCQYSSNISRKLAHILTTFLIIWLDQKCLWTEYMHVVHVWCVCVHVVCVWACGVCVCGVFVCMWCVVLCLWVCVCVYIYMYVCMPVWMHVCTYS